MAGGRSPRTTTSPVIVIKAIQTAPMSLMILMAGPYRSDTGDDAETIAANHRTIQEARGTRPGTTTCGLTPPAPCASGRAAGDALDEAAREERERLWQLDATVYPARATYAGWTAGRRIPVMVLEPAAADSPTDPEALP
jgi:hypothetical protein